MLNNHNTPTRDLMMKAVKFAALTIASVALGLVLGCEGSDSPAESDVDRFFQDNPFVSDPRGHEVNIVRLSPTSATIEAIGQQVLISARGGSGPYTWDVAVPAYGTIDTSSNWRQAIYTANTLNVNSVIVYDRSGHAAIATIRPPTGQALGITANPETILVDGGTSVLDATGGVPPYTWTVGNPDRGVISSTTGNSIIYTRVSEGDNGVTLVDQNGTIANIIISQP